MPVVKEAEDDEQEEEEEEKGWRQRRGGGRGGGNAAGCGPSVRTEERIRRQNEFLFFSEKHKEFAVVMLIFRAIYTPQ